MAKQNETKPSYKFNPIKDVNPYTTISEILQKNAVHCPNREALVVLTKSGERTSLTYSDLLKKSVAFAKGLVEIGTKPKDVVAISNKNCIEWMIATCGVQILGAVPLHFFFKMSDGSEVRDTLTGIPHCTTLIIDPGEEDKRIETIKNFVEFDSDNLLSVSSSSLLDLKRVIVMAPSRNCKTYTTISDILNIGTASSSSLPAVDPDDIAQIFLTSGSTGIPKAVQYTHVGLLRNMQGFASSIEINQGSVHYNDRPFSWIVGYPLSVLMSKATLVSSSNIAAFKTPREINEFAIRAFDSEKCTSAVMIGPCLYELMESDIPPCRHWPLNVVATGGLPVDSMCAKAAGRIANKFVVLYGSTEMGLVNAHTVSTPDDFEDYAVGYPIQGMEVKIVDDYGFTVPCGTYGEMYVRNRDRFLGYLNAPEKSSACCNRTGWFKTDDIGVMRENGCFVVTGRKSDMMILGGAKVSTVFYESILKRHPNVKEAFIYPVHDKEMFQLAYAAVVASPKGSITEEDLKRFVSEQTSSNTDSFIDRYRLPEHYIFYQSFPRTNNGKLDRKATRDMIISTKGLK